MTSSFDTTIIPLVDFSPFLNGSAEDRTRVALSIDAAFKTHGFIYLSNHGIDQRKVDECFDWSKRFFNLTLPQRKNMQPSQSRAHRRGYLGVGNEKVREHACTKESFNYGNPKDELQPNIWPPEEWLPGFRSSMEDFFGECTNLGHQLLYSLSLALNLSSSDALSKSHSRSTFSVDLLHYPGATQVLHARNLARFPEHSDLGTLTLLFQDSIGGLEIADPHSENSENSGESKNNRSFKPVRPLPGTVIVNVGYLLKRWSNGRWKDTIHRVVEPPESMPAREASNDGTFTAADIGSVQALSPERYSIPFCIDPDPEAMIEALPGCWNEDNPKKWKPIEAGAYFQKKLNTVYS